MRPVDERPDRSGGNASKSSSDKLASPREGGTTEINAIEFSEDEYPERVKVTMTHREAELVAKLVGCLSADDVNETTAGDSHEQCEYDLWVA